MVHSVRHRSNRCAVCAGSSKLLFFAGHVPKLHINNMRYRLWKALLNHSDVTALSSTLECTVGAYDVCTSAARVAAEYKTFCYQNKACRPRAGGLPCTTSPEACSTPSSVSKCIWCPSARDADPLQCAHHSQPTTRSAHERRTSGSK